MAQGRGLNHRGCGADQVTSTSGNTVTSLLFRPTISGKTRNSSTLVYSQALPDSRTERNFVREESADHRFQHPLSVESEMDHHLPLSIRISSPRVVSQHLPCTYKAVRGAMPLPQFQRCAFLGYCCMGSGE
ncbi:hypothetical protein B0H13DRAFT_1857377 [Mycena leptocephala]|nr:hypothetical protein B0H13DRAFT_1857377 [Mycena leptocephala]